MNHSQRPVHIYFRQEIYAVPPWYLYKLSHEYAVIHICGPLGIDGIVGGVQNGQVTVLLRSMWCWPATVQRTTVC